MANFINLNDIYFPLTGGTINGDVKLNGSLIINEGNDSSYDVAAKITELNTSHESLRKDLDDAALNIEKLYLGLNSNLPYEKDGWLVVPMGKYVQLSRNVTHTGVSITSSWGVGVYESTSAYGGLDFPFEFVEKPTMNLSVVGTSSYAVMGIECPFGVSSLSTTNTGLWYYYRPDNNANDIDVTVSITVIGKIVDDRYDDLMNDRENLIKELEEQKKELEELYNELNKES